ncbi:MAG: terminase large subunit [Dehalococcoidia bacterium]
MGARRWYSYGPDVTSWIEANCVLPSGEHIGRPFRLMAWQKDWINELYACDAKGNLRYRWSLLGIPKKNGKSTMIAALALYHLMADPDEADPWAVCAAASDRQADLVFNAAKLMCELSPALRDATDRYRWEIRPKGRPGRLERVAASAGKLDGKNISFLVVDELHEWNLENWAILTNGTVGRRRAQIVQITTAGHDLETICGREYQKGQRILAGEEKNPGYLFRWFQAPDGADYREEETWRAANPSYGVLVTKEQLADKVANVPQAQFERYFLNRWTRTEETWLPAGAWDACRVGPFEFEPDQPLYGAVDAATKEDSTAVVLAQWHGEKLRLRARIWERPTDMNGAPVQDWVLPLAEVEQHLRDLDRDFDFHFGIDPRFLERTRQVLEADGLSVEEVPQSDSRMVPASQSLFELVVQGNVEHEGDPAFTRHIDSAVAREAFSGGWRLSKGRSRKKMDAAVAAAMAAHIAVQERGRAPAAEPRILVLG